MPNAYRADTHSFLEFPMRILKTLTSMKLSTKRALSKRPYIEDETSGSKASAQRFDIARFTLKIALLPSNYGPPIFSLSAFAGFPERSKVTSPV
jgi:hypothetical protein